MAKVSKNARVNRGGDESAKSMVKVIVPVRSEKTGAYVYKEKMVHKDNVKDFVKNAE